MIICDHREEASGLPGMLILEGADLEMAQLQVGDYIASERVIIERKSAADFVASLKDGRLFSQAKRLREACERPFLILEGSPRFNQNSINGALSSVMRSGVMVILTRDVQESAQWIRRLEKQEAKDGASSRRPAGIKRKERLKDEIAEDALAAVPGISVKKARDLLAHFGSLSEVAQASAQELQEVAGIGPKMAKNLYEILSHRYERV